MNEVTFLIPHHSRQALYPLNEEKLSLLFYVKLIIFFECLKIFAMAENLEDRGPFHAEC